MNGQTQLLIDAIERIYGNHGDYYTDAPECAASVDAAAVATQPSG